MSYNIICPYCFNETNGGRPMKDDDVMFRSELVNHGEPDILPPDFDGLDDFVARYNKADKHTILTKYQELSFFAAGVDSEYEKFWAKYGGTTEFNPPDDLLKVKAYYRKVIDPKDPNHQKYLKKQPDDTFFIRDNQGMVSQIQLSTGERCHRRVCRFCHNPLPGNYGKNPVKFAAIIGITGAGKTVYLSQLLKKMRTYVTKVGLTASVTNAGVSTFTEKNSVVAKKPLPGSTPAQKLQQPLFYELARDAQEHGKITETFVLYDVAGEVFRDETNALVHNFAPFIKHANCAIVLIDPMQFEVISGSATTGSKLDDPTTALNTIHHIISRGNTTEKCAIPFAICLSKADREEIQNVLPDDLRNLLLDDVRGVNSSDGFFKPIFNAIEYAPIATELSKFIKNNELPLAQMMQTNYSSYAYFAFTALGCDVEEGKMDNGEQYQYPVGPVLPKRLEEPLFWLFYKLGYIEKNAPLPGEIFCPTCGSQNNYELPEDERIIVEQKWFSKVERFVNRHCKTCDCKWEYNPGK